MIISVSSAFVLLVWHFLDLIRSIK